MKDFEKFKTDKHNLEGKIAELIQEFDKKYGIELKYIDFKSYLIFADQETKTIEINLDFDI